MNRNSSRSTLANAIAVKRLDHPNIVRVLDIATDGDRVWMAMDVAAGGSLAERLGKSGPLPQSDVVRVATAVCRALEHAHAHGVLHLDVKPANVLFDGDGRVVLADFGGDTRGTPGFAPPEVERGAAAIDARADVYGVGALVAAMAGPGRSALGPVVARAMAREPADRYASVGELAAALQSAAGDSRAGSGAAAHEPPVPALPSDAGTRPFGPRPPLLVAPAPHRRRRYRLLWAGSGVLVAGALVLGALAATSTISTTDAGAAGERREHGACSDGATSRNTRSIDVDGDGCADPVTVDGNVVTWNGLRFSVGDPAAAGSTGGGSDNGDDSGDVVLVGDWDCDGIATVALWRPAAGVAFLYDGWPGPAGAADAELPPSRRVSLPPGAGPPTPCRA